MKDSTNGIMRIMRIAAWMWLVYLLFLTGIDWFLYDKTSYLSLGPYYLINSSIALLFFFLAHCSWCKQKLKRAMVPLMLVIIAGFSITVNQLFIPQLPPGPISNVEGVAFRLLPILIIGLVIVAWHYPLPVIVLYSIGTAALQMFFLLLNSKLHLEPHVFEATAQVTTVQSISFLVVGFFINRLIQILQKQQEDLAITNARLVHHASIVEQLTISRERNRMARELHDTLAHTLSGLSVQLETTQAYWEADPHTARGLLEKSLAATRSGLDETRRALKALRASPIDDLGLLIALEKLAESAAERGNFNLSLSLPKDINSLSTDGEQCIYRIAQEALENAVHHSNAENVVVTLSKTNGEINLTIEDDGLGFEIEYIDQEGHFGLAGMQERAQIAGGRLTITSKPDQGTQIELRLQGKDND
jgi:signal transduction histidine kinase